MRLLVSNRILRNRSFLIDVLASDIYWSISDYPSQKEPWVDHAGCNSVHIHQLGDCHNDECINNVFTSQGNVWLLFLSSITQSQLIVTNFRLGHLKQICVRAFRYAFIWTTARCSPEHAHAGRLVKLLNIPDFSLSLLLALYTLSRCCKSLGLLPTPQLD